MKKCNYRMRYNIFSQSDFILCEILLYYMQIVERKGRDRMNSIERKKFMIERLEQQGHVLIGELSEQLGVSTMTIRRDLAKLEQEGLISMESGGAILKNQMENPFVTPAKALKKSKEKQKMAEKCLEFIQEGNTVFIDAGTTTGEISKYISKIPNVLAFTNSLYAANHMSMQNQPFVMVPGEYKECSMAFAGPLTNEFLQKFKFDLLFLGVEGIDLEHGVSVPDISEGMAKEIMIDQAEKVICVADSSKFHQSFLYRFDFLSSIDVIITDQGMKEEDRKQYEEAGITLIIV